MERVGGRVGVYGSVAYVSQQPWMQNQTVRSNITFGKRYNEALYEEVLQACSLHPDLRVLSTGDMTEIGEKVSRVNVLWGHCSSLSPSTCRASIYRAGRRLELDWLGLCTSEATSIFSTILYRQWTVTWEHR